MTDISEKKTIVTDFLNKCNRYADGMLQKYRDALVSEPDSEEIQRKILKWQAYREYNEHAIRELQTSELDDWFT